MARAPTPALPDRPTTRDLKVLRRTAVFLKPYRGAMIGAALALCVTAAATLSIGVGLQRLIDRGLSAGNPAMLDRALLLMLGVIAIIAAGTFARYYLVTWLGERVVADIRSAVFDRVLTLNPGFFEVTKTGEILSRLTTDTTLIQTVIGSSASVALRNLLTLSGGLVMLFVTNVKLAGMVVLVVPLVVVPIVVFGRKVRRLSRASQDRISDVSSYAEEVLYGIRTVQAFTHEAIDRRRFGDATEAAFATAVRRTRARAALTAVVILLVFGAIGLVLWAGGHDVLQGDITPGELTAFVFYAVVVASATGAVSEVMGDLQRAAGATERLVELLETRPDVETPAHPKPLPQPPQGRVQMEGVAFHYPSRPDRAALHGFDLTIEPGERVALVGPSGAGKSTVMQLILRFYDPHAGRILLDGVDLREMAPTDLRSRLGLVPQEPIIFSADAMENIRYGRPDASDAEVRAAAEAAQALEFIERLPEGFNTFLGEKGVRLSGGQRQRIAIARALLRDPCVLLLDEATSALDAESERLVQQALERLMAGRTSLVIAHRLATVVSADRIAVVDDGRLVATGTHAQLLESSPLYARLAELQFGRQEAAA
ncbi:ABC transporter transmembrane domain-containing protein [Caenispirillum bisanense]|uniref:ATP-binding cassette, subfamily B n=1 Tax=Caenispirillum bisanense TaxID=414052 RepID=A0A286H028_9PROT|nr:ABC transporter transmembrane domain-containing protein [Caenispirillum bisanense]SOE01072.1 ATP-binding cassette, subfamily B [Caenispirillum bisanense]